MEARNANLKVRKKTSQCIIFSLSGCVKIFAEEFSVTYLPAQLECQKWLCELH